MQIVLSRVCDIFHVSHLLYSFLSKSRFSRERRTFGGLTEKSEFPPVPSISRINSRGPESYGRNHCRLLWILFNSTHVYVVSISRIYSCALPMF